MAFITEYKWGEELQWGMYYPNNIGYYLALATICTKSCRQLYIHNSQHDNRVFSEDTMSHLLSGFTFDVSIVLLL